MIGYWSELKLDIVREYAVAYSKILTKNRLYHVYIDAFAGSGLHISKVSGQFVKGSPLNALLIDPPFREFFFVDLVSKKTDRLRQIVGNRTDVHIYQGDCNEILRTEVLPQARYEDYRRALCLLDPYGLHLDWNVIAEAGAMKSIDIFLNFPIMDINRNFLWRHPGKIGSSQTNRLDAFWGDNSWRNIAYKTVPALFEDEEQKQENKVIADSFCDRLRKLAGFQHVSRALPMRNTRHAIVYYLLFASQKRVAKKILEDIFRKYETRGIGSGEIKH